MVPGAGGLARLATLTALVTAEMAWLIQLPALACFTLAAELAGVPVVMVLVAETAEVLVEIKTPLRQTPAAVVAAVELAVLVLPVL